VMSTDDVPIRATGPGSQPEQPGDASSFLPLPTTVDSYRAPLLPEPEEVAHLHGALETLKRVQTLLETYRPGTPTRKLDLAFLTAGEMELIDQILGDGEVSVRYDGPPALEIQESILAGVWRVRSLNRNSGEGVTTLEVGELPAVLQHASFRAEQPQLPSGPEDTPAGVRNARSVLVELLERSRSCRAGDSAHVINLTLLPQSPEDIAYLRAQLGRGTVTILSRGFGNCRITATAVPNVWWVQFFNSMDTLILNTLEVVDVPAVVRAAAEDLQDSALRLGEIRSSLR